MRRTVIAGLAAGAACMALPGTSEANVSLGVACQPPMARVVLDGFVPGRAISGSLLVTLDGQTVHVGTHAFTGPQSLLTFPLPRGRGWLVAAYAAGTERWSDARAVECEGPVAPLPPAPPGEPVPPVVETAPPPSARPAIDCAHLRRVGAGRRWLVRFGCVRPQPRITCRALKARGAGRGWYARLGIRYFECHVPRPPRRPFLPPVTG